MSWGWVVEVEVYCEVGRDETEAALGKSSRRGGRGMSPSTRAGVGAYSADLVFRWMGYHVVGGSSS